MRLYLSFLILLITCNFTCSCDYPWFASYRVNYDQDKLSDPMCREFIIDLGHKLANGSCLVEEQTLLLQREDIQGCVVYWKNCCGTLELIHKNFMESLHSKMTTTKKVREMTTHSKTKLLGTQNTTSETNTSTEVAMAVDSIKSTIPTLDENDRTLAKYRISHCPVFTAINGKVACNIKNANCTIKVMDSTFELKNCTHEYILYGPFDWFCDETCFGSLSSSFTGCDSCSFCQHNEMIKGCEAKSLPTFIGILLGVTITILSVMIIRWTYLVLTWFQVRDRVVYKFNKLFHRYKERKHNRTLKMVGNLLEIPKSESLEMRKFELFNLKENGFDSIENESLEDYLLRMQRTRDRITVLEELIKLEERNHIKIKEFQRPELDKPKRRKYCLLRFFIRCLVFLPNPVNSCDQTFYVKSNSQLCRDKSCVEQFSGLIEISTNGKVCLFTDKNEFLHIFLQDLKVINYYKPLYLTSDFELMGDSYTACEGAGECRKFSVENDNYIPKDFEIKLKRLYPNVTGRLYSSSSYNYHETNSNNCEACFYDDECVYYSGKLYTKGPFFTVAKFYKSEWVAHLTLITKNLTRSFKLSSSRPVLESIVRVSVISNPIGVSYRTPNYLLITDKNLAFDVQASEMNFPVWGQIGDVQVDLYKTKFIHPYQIFTTQTLGCHRMMIAQQPAIKTFQQTISNRQGLSFRINDNDYSWQSPSLSKLLFSVTTSNSFDNVHVSNPKCTFKPPTVLCCSGCAEAATVTFQTETVETEGSYDMNSNCSTDWSLIECTSSIQVFKITGTPDYCQFDIPKINKSFLLQMNCIFKGSLSEIGAIKISYNEEDIPFWDNFNHMVSNPNFMSALQWSLIASVGLVVLIKILLVVATAYLTKKETEKILSISDDKVEMEDLTRSPT